MHCESKDKENPKKPKKAETCDKTTVPRDSLDLGGSEWLNKNISEEFKEFFGEDDCDELYSDLSYKKLRSLLFMVKFRFFGKM